jgi:subtilisin-like proprotein convertase family protein
MKRLSLVTVAAVAALVQSAQADFVFNSGFQNGGVIPDGSLTGWSDTRTVSGLSGPITDVNVGLELTGGWNGDLYAYLVHSSGFTVLLNRVGRGSSSSTGYGDHGMNVTLDDAATLNIHTYGGGGVPSGPYQPDGRNISPLASTGDFASATPTTSLSSFNGLDPNGSWTLFIADVSGGDISTLATWTLALDVAAVPEPASLIEGTVAVLFLGGVVALYRLRGRKQQPQSC